MPYCFLEKEYIDKEDCGECEMCPDEDYEKKERKDKKEQNLKWSTEFLIKNKVPFEKSSQYHYRVCGQYNFWPSTGKYIKITVEKNGSHKSGRGVKNLLRELNIKYV